MHGDDLNPPEWTEQQDWLDYHEAGDVLRGLVTERSEYETKNGPLVVIVIETAEGNEHRIPLGRSGLKPIVTKHQIDKGDEVAIGYHGKSDSGYFRYTFEVRKGSYRAVPEPEPSTSGTWG